MDFLPHASPMVLAVLGGLMVFIPSFLMLSSSGLALTRKTRAMVILAVFAAASAFTALGGLHLTGLLTLDPFVIILIATVLGVVAGYGFRRMYVSDDKQPLRSGPTGRG
jgi:hypothetical protein